MTTRSTTLFATVGPLGSNVLLFQCPASTVALFKSFLIWNPGPDPGNVALVVRRQNPAIAVVVFQGQLTAGISHEWNGWMALEPSDQITASATVAGMEYWGSGALLPLPTS